MKHGFCGKMVLWLCLFCAAALACNLQPVHAQTKGKMSGKVIQIDKSLKTLTVLGNEGMSFEAGRAKYRGCKSMNDINKGDAVEVAYTMKQGKATANIITKKGKAKKK